MTNDSAQAELLTDAEVSVLLHNKPATLRHWRARKQGPPFIRINGRRVLYRRTDVDAWIASKVVQP